MKARPIRQAQGKQAPGKRLLVTGGAGFIGSNFIHYWLKNHPEDSIINLDSLTYAGNLENLAVLKDNPHYRFIKGSITDPKIIEQAIQGVHWVVHFAAETHVDRSILGPAVFIETNVLGTQVLLDAAVKAKIKRFHHISTDEVFGALKLGDNKKFNEQTPYNPRSPYSASKAASEHLVRAYAETFGLPITISNCSNNYGPYQFPEKLIPLAITNLLEGKKVPVYGDGLYVRDWLYVEDHCRAIDVILQKGTVGETYCVGGMDKDVSNLEIIKTLLSVLKKDMSAIEYVKDRPGHDRRYAVDFSKIVRELGWKPAFDFEHGIKATIDWYIKNKAWWAHIKSGEYKKYYAKQYGKKK